MKERKKKRLWLRMPPLKDNAKIFLMGFSLRAPIRKKEKSKKLEAIDPTYEFSQKMSLMGFENTTRHRLFPFPLISATHKQIVKNK